MKLFFLRSKFLANPGFGDHPSVTYEDDTVKLKTFSDFANLAPQCCGISGVAFEHLYPDRPTITLTQ